MSLADRAVNASHRILAALTEVDAASSQNASTGLYDRGSTPVTPFGECLGGGGPVYPLPLQNDDRATPDLRAAQCTSISSILCTPVNSQSTLR
ncbi:hypothetical protein R75483_06237 [Paraburkholderia domus]|nr:hypothetical protein R75483_06237 [Paraburkholderia domus]